MGTRELIGTLEGHTNEVRSVAFSPPDGALLASAGGYEDRTVKLWDVETRELIGTLEGHENEVSAVAFSPDGNILASVSWDGIRLWSVTTREPIVHLEGAGGRQSVAFSHDGQSLVSGSWGTVQLWDLTTRGSTAALQGHTGLVHSVAFSRDGTTLATGAQDGTMLLWQIQLLQPRPHTLTKVSSVEQQVPAGALAKPFVVLVRDQYGNPSAGATVTFAVTAGGGTLSVTTAVTDADGRASTTLTLGPQPGINTVEAIVDRLQPVMFTATGLAVPRTLVKLSGDEQQAAAGAQLAEPLVVSVRDQNGAALPGAVVTFSVLGEGGTLSAAADTTDAEGLAGTTLALGEELGTYRIVATAADLEPVTFTATAEATPDFNGDGVTDFSDFFLFAEAFGGRDPRFDLGRQRLGGLRRLLPLRRGLRPAGAGQAAGHGPGAARAAGRPAAAAERAESLQQRDRHLLVPAAARGGAPGGVYRDGPARGRVARGCREGRPSPPALGRAERPGSPPGQRGLRVPAGDR